MAYRALDKITFVHIAKCGGNGIADWIRKSEYQYSGMPHEVPGKLPTKWQDDLFCVVRNPWSRVVSFYTYFKKTWTKHNKSKYLKVLDKGFEHFVMNCEDWHPEIDPSIGLPWNKQLCSLYCHENMRYLRLENFSKDFEQIKKICNRTDNPVWMNKSNTEPYQSFYNDRTINRVGEMFEEDIKRFNYSY